MPELDPARKAVARKIVKNVFGKEYDPQSDVSGRTSDPIYQAMYSERFNNAGELVVEGGKWRWTTVLPTDIQKVKVFGHFYALAYSHLSPVASLIQPELAEGLSLGVEEVADLNPTIGGKNVPA